MGVVCAVVGSTGDYFRGRFRCNVVNCEGVFIVSVANLAADVFGVGAFVDEALCIVDIAIFGGASGLAWVRGVRDVDEDEAAFAGRVTGLRTGGDDVVGGLGDDDVVGTSDRELVEPAGQVGFGGEDFGRGREWVPGGADCKEL